MNKQAMTETFKTGDHIKGSDGCVLRIIAFHITAFSAKAKDGLGIFVPYGDVFTKCFADGDNKIDNGVK